MDLADLTQRLEMARKPEPPNTVTSVSTAMAVMVRSRASSDARNVKPVEAYRTAARAFDKQDIASYLRLSRLSQQPTACCHGAQVAELVDALVSGTSAARRGGSSPLLGTNSAPHAHEQPR